MAPLHKFFKWIYCTSIRFSYFLLKYRMPVGFFFNQKMNNLWMENILNSRPGQAALLVNQKCHKFGISAKAKPTYSRSNQWTRTERCGLIDSLGGEWTFYAQMQIIHFHCILFIFIILSRAIRTKKNKKRILRSTLVHSTVYIAVTSYAHVQMYPLSHCSLFYYCYYCARIMCSKTILLLIVHSLVHSSVHTAVTVICPRVNVHSHRWLFHYYYYCARDDDACNNELLSKIVRARAKKWTTRAQVLGQWVATTKNAEHKTTPARPPASSAYYISAVHT